MSKRTFFLASSSQARVRPQTAANPAGFGPAAAAASVKGFKVPEGLKVSLFASEPLVRNPTDMDIDERGRVWITEGGNYRSSFKHGAHCSLRVTGLWFWKIQMAMAG